MKRPKNQCNYVRGKTAIEGICYPFADLRQQKQVLLPEWIEIGIGAQKKTIR